MSFVHTENVSLDEILTSGTKFCHLPRTSCDLRFAVSTLGSFYTSEQLNGAVLSGVDVNLFFLCRLYVTRIQ